jgi:hypothetical protein
MPSVENCWAFRTGFPEAPLRDFHDRGDAIMLAELTLRREALVCALSGVLALGAVVGQSTLAGAQTAPISEQEAHAIGVDAYLYFYPLVTMDLTRRQMTNVAAGKELGFGPPNTFNNVPAYPSASDRVVVRPNFDTLYSIAWLDLAKEPAIVSVPDTNGRYYLLPMLDMWTDVFASPGWRTTGRKPNISLSHLRAGDPTCAIGSLRSSGCRETRSVSMRPHPTCGSSAGPRQMDPRTTMRSTRFRLA